MLAVSLVVKFGVNVGLFVREQAVQVASIGIIKISSSSSFSLRYIYSQEFFLLNRFCSSKICDSNIAIVSIVFFAIINGTVKEISFNSVCFSFVLIFFIGCVFCCTVRVLSLRLRVSVCWINVFVWRIGSVIGIESAGMLLKRLFFLMAILVVKIQAVVLLS